MSYPFGLIIAYHSSITLDKAKEELDNLRKQYDLNFGPTALFILDRGSCTICDPETPINYSLFPNSNSIFSIQNSEVMGENLMLLYILIISGLFSEDPLAYQPDIISYAKKSGFTIPTKHFDKKDLQNCIIEMDGKHLDIAKMSKVQEYFASLSVEERLDPNNAKKIFQMLNEACPDFFD